MPTLCLHGAIAAKQDVAIVGVDDRDLIVRAVHPEPAEACSEGMKAFRLCDAQDPAAAPPGEPELASGAWSVGDLLERAARDQP